MIVVDGCDQVINLFYPLV